MDSAWWGTFALLMVAMCLTVTGELLLKTGMNRHGVLEVSFSTLIPTAGKLLGNPFVVGGFVVRFQRSPVLAGRAFALAAHSGVSSALNQLHHRHMCVRDHSQGESEPDSGGGGFRDNPWCVPDQPERGVTTESTHEPRPVPLVNVAPHTGRVEHQAVRGITEPLPDIGSAAAIYPDAFTLTVIIPAFNEGDAIHKVIGKISRTAAGGRDTCRGRRVV